MAVGQNQWYHFGGGAPPLLVYFGGDWDVHWRYGILTYGHNMFFGARVSCKGLQGDESTQRQRQCRYILEWAYVQATKLSDRPNMAKFRIASVCLRVTAIHRFTGTK